MLMQMTFMLLLLLPLLALSSSCQLPGRLRRLGFQFALSLPGGVMSRHYSACSIR